MIPCVPRPPLTKAAGWALAAAVLTLRYMGTCISKSKASHAQLWAHRSRERGSGGTLSLLQWVLLRTACDAMPAARL